MVRLALIADPRCDIIGVLEELGGLFEEMEVKLLLPLNPEIPLPPGVLEDEEERERFMEGFASGLEAGVKRRVEEKWGEVEVVLGGGEPTWVLKECLKDRVALLVVKAPRDGGGAIGIDLKEIMSKTRDSGIPLLYLP